MGNDQFGKQIVKERRAGKPEKQAVAIAAEKLGISKNLKLSESTADVPMSVPTTIPTTLPTLEDSKFGKK